MKDEPISFHPTEYNWCYRAQSYCFLICVLHMIKTSMIFSKSCLNFLININTGFFLFCVIQNYFLIDFHWYFSNRRLCQNSEFFLLVLQVDVLIARFPGVSVQVRLGKENADKKWDNIVNATFLQNIWHTIWVATQYEIFSKMSEVVINNKYEVHTVQSQHFVCWRSEKATQVPIPGHKDFFYRIWA